MWLARMRKPNVLHRLPAGVSAALVWASHARILTFHRQGRSTRPHQGMCISGVGGFHDIYYRNSRVALLEGQVGQLTSQVSALTRQNDLNRRISPETPIDISNSLTNDSGSSQGQRLESEDISMLLDAAKDPSHGLAPPISSALAGQPSLVDRGLFSESETENLIQTFKSAFVPKFPFVLIASTETAVQLGKREPFLFLCVIAATIGSSHPLRKKVTEEVMNHITLRVVERSERNLELLQGLLVYSAWYTYPAERYHPQLLLLIQFCVSILYDLGLHKKSTASLDEQRALLGTYWLSSR